MSESIAFIGLGAMGGPMAQNIIKKGSKVSVFDIVTEKIDPVVKVGGTPGKTIKDTIENAEIILFHCSMALARAQANRVWGP